MLMRILILSAVLVISQQADDIKERAKYMEEQFMIIKRTCARIHGLTMVQIRDVENNFDEPRNKKDKCVLECYFTQAGAMTHGRFNRDGADNIVEYLYEDDDDTIHIGKEITKTCEKKEAAAKVSNGCDAAFQIYNCLKKEIKQRGFKMYSKDY